MVCAALATAAAGLARFAAQAFYYTAVVKAPFAAAMEADKGTKHWHTKQFHFGAQGPCLARILAPTGRSSGG